MLHGAFTLLMCTKVTTHKPFLQEMTKHAQLEEAFNGILTVIISYCTTALLSIKQCTSRRYSQRSCLGLHSSAIAALLPKVPKVLHLGVFSEP